MRLNFAETFKRLRKEKEMTQEAISEVLGVSAQSVSRWELGVCYPDLEMLPAIANYFDVSIDTLLSNDSVSKSADEAAFNERINSLSNETTESIDFVKEYCSKYPESDYYASQLVYAIKRHVVGDEVKTAKYMPLLKKTARRLLETRYREVTIRSMAIICPEEELQEWLDMTPYSYFSRRRCLVSRAEARRDNKGMFIQHGLEMLEGVSKQLDHRYPDCFGSRKKIEFQRKVMQTVRSFGENGEIPDGWKLFYAYKQFVLSACLFGAGETEDGWEEFRSALDKYKYVFSLDSEWLDIGGPLFSNLKVNKPWSYAIDADGNKHKLFAVVNFSYYNIKHILDLLKNPRWAWFNSVRNTPEYKAAIQWAEDIAKKQFSE